MLPRDATNLVASAMLAELEATEVPWARRCRLSCHNTIPCASGLGSSSSATLAGLIFAQAVGLQSPVARPGRDRHGSVLNEPWLSKGHGDNVAPALFGGFVIVVPDSSRRAHATHSPRADEDRSLRSRLSPISRPTRVPRCRQHTAKPIRSTTSGGRCSLPKRCAPVMTTCSPRR